MPVITGTWRMDSMSTWAFSFRMSGCSIGEDNLATGSGQPNNGGDPNAPAGQSNPNAPFIDYSKVSRFHEDDSIVWKYYDPQGLYGRGVSRMAMSATVDLGCEYGGGVHCTSGSNKANFSA